MRQQVLPITTVCIPYGGLSYTLCAYKGQSYFENQVLHVTIKLVRTILYFYSHNMVVYKCQDIPYLVPVAATITVVVPPSSSGHSVALRSVPLGSLFAVDSVIEWTPI